MPRHEGQDESGYTVPGTGTTVSRRTLMKTAAGAGIAVAVASSIGVAHAATTGTGAVTPEAGAPIGGATPTGIEATAGGPVVAHVSDARTGTLDIYHGLSRTQVQDHDLAARVTRLATSSPIVVHVTDATIGSIEVFGEGTRRQITDTSLAGRIVRAA